MRPRHYLPLAFILLTAWPALAQDLSQLQDRAVKLWELRKQANKLDALQLIDPQTRQAYLQGNEPPIISFKVTGLEFTDDRNRIVVVSKVREVLPQIGEIDLAVREPWIWKDRKWSMQVIAPSTPFSKDGSPDLPAPDRVPPKLEISGSTIDLGQHTQGDIVEGKIPFVANRDEIRKIELGQALPGLSIKPPVWTNEKEGYLPIQWNTTLVWNDVNQTVPLDVLGTNDGRTSVPVPIQARIKGKVGFKQVPEIIDTANSGQFELQIQNLSTTAPLKILSVLSYNAEYKVSDDVPESIAPGASGRLLITYPVQAKPVGAALALVLSESIGPSPVTVIPIQVKLPQQKSPGVTQEELQRIIKATPRPVLP